MALRSPAGLLIFATYFGAIGYGIAKTGLDKKLVQAIRSEQEHIAEIQAKAFVKEMTASKVVTAAIDTPQAGNTTSG